jgi:CHAT domain-containing protein
MGSLVTHDTVYTRFPGEPDCLKGLLDNPQTLPTRGSTAQLPGKIALTPAASDTGFLTANEILTQRLVADLVVLSACDTGRGKITGDGVLGLARAFIAAGAPSLVVSLWAVPDAPPLRT